MLHWLHNEVVQYTIMLLYAATLSTSIICLVMAGMVGFLVVGNIDRAVTTRDRLAVHMCHR